MNRQWVMGLCVLSVAMFVGCKNDASADKKVKPSGKATEVAKAAEGKHDGWWCDEHGIPEEECSMCNSKVAAEFKKKGDWCDKHDRAKSQCFICEPKLKETYAAKYRAKFGKEPPAIEDESKKDPKKG